MAAYILANGTDFSGSVFFEIKRFLYLTWGHVGACSVTRILLIYNPIQDVNIALHFVTLLVDLLVFILCHSNRFHIPPLDFGNPILLMIYSRGVEHSRIRHLFSLARLRVTETWIMQVFNWWFCSYVIVQHFCLVVIKPKLLLHCHFISHFGK